MLVTDAATATVPSTVLNGALLLAGDDDRADDRDRRDRVGQRHQRRVQQPRDVLNDLEADERRQQEHERHRPEIQRKASESSSLGAPRRSKTVLSGAGRRRSLLESRAATVPTDDGASQASCFSRRARSGLDFRLSRRHTREKSVASAFRRKFGIRNRPPDAIRCLIFWRTGASSCARQLVKSDSCRAGPDGWTQRTGPATGQRPPIQMMPGRDRPPVVRVGTAVLKGRVVDGATGAGVPRARVMIRAPRAAVHRRRPMAPAASPSRAFPPGP